MNAELVFIGTELLLGEIANSNAGYLARELAELGVDVYRQNVVGDNVERLTSVLAEACARADAVLTTGGLGPTMDDVTREALARLTGRSLREDAGLRSDLEAYLASRGVSMTDNNLRQATLPEGARAVANSVGTAPGIALEHESCLLVAMPGPPREMQPMYREQVRPLLRRRLPGGGTRLHRRTLRICALPEAAVEDRLRDVIAGQGDPTLALYARSGEVRLRLASKAASAAEAEARFAPVERVVRERLGWRCYGRDEETLASAVGHRLRERELTLAVAESCTGGLVGDRITDVPGCSAYFLLSLVTYADDVKAGLLGVPAGLLARHGAVSEPVAVAMARGARARAGAGVGLAVTGIAGPGGGSAEKPVGTVYVAVAGRGEPRRRHLRLRGNRVEIKRRTATHALALLLEHLSPGNS